jgi:hypothetical protein
VIEDFGCKWSGPRPAIGPCVGRGAASLTLCPVPGYSGPSINPAFRGFEKHIYYRWLGKQGPCKWLNWERARSCPTFEDISGRCFRRAHITLLRGHTPSKAETGQPVARRLAGAHTSGAVPASAKWPRPAGGVCYDPAGHTLLPATLWRRRRRRERRLTRPSTARRRAAGAFFRRSSAKRAKDPGECTGWGSAGGAKVAACS